MGRRADFADTNRQNWAAARLLEDLDMDAQRFGTDIVISYGMCNSCRQQNSHLKVLNP